jgi:hypothetical protein
MRDILRNLRLKQKVSYLLLLSSVPVLLCHPSYIAGTCNRLAMCLQQFKLAQS